MTFPLLILSTGLYGGIAISALFERNFGLAIMFLGYTIGNIGIMAMQS